VTFPAEAVPDGHVFAPHHLTWGALLAGLVVFVVADNYRHREPLAALFGVVLALFGFLTVWKFYPATGALLTLGGCALVLAGVCWPGGIWTSYPLRWRVLAFLAGCVALDDAVSHAFGVWTPVDWLWTAHVAPLLG
jgi:hypothetical protein